MLGMYQPISFQMNEEFNKNKKQEDTKKSYSMWGIIMKYSNFNKRINK